MEDLNLVVSILAIVISAVSIVLSILFSSNANAALRDIRDRAQSIERDVQDRLTDVVQRALPSEKERSISSALPNFVDKVFSNPETVKILLQEFAKQPKEHSE